MHRELFLALGLLIGGLPTAVFGNTGLPDGDRDGIPDAWETAQGLNPNDAADAESDGDADGLKALVEYGLGGSTTTDDRALLPQLEFVENDGDVFVRFSFARRQDNPCLAVIPEFSVDAGATEEWSAESLELVEGPVRLAGGFEEVTYQSAVTVEEEERQFLRARLRVVRQILNTGLGDGTEITSPVFGEGGTTTLLPGDFVVGRTGNAALVAGAGKVIKFPVTEPGGTNLDLNRGEIEFWYLPEDDFDADANERVLFAVGSYGGQPSMALVKTSVLTFRIGTASRTDSVSSKAGVRWWFAAEWVHIRATWDNSSAEDSLQVFVNGRRVSEGRAEGGWSLAEGGAPTEFWLGSADDAGQNPSGGTFDEMVVRDHRQAWEDTNSEPLLTPIPAKWVVKGNTLNFSAVATDPDGDDLSYTLEPGAPATATLNPSTGAFFFPTLAGDAPTSYEFCIRVTDNGTPRMSDVTKVFIGVVGNNPPILSNLTPSAQQITPGEVARVNFDWADPDRDITTVTVSPNNVFGAFSSDYSRTTFGIKGEMGTATLEIETEQLPYGVTTFWLNLTDSLGNMSNAEVCTVEVVGLGGGGTTPTVSIFSRMNSQVTKPFGPLDVTFPNFNTSIIDQDGDLERLRLAVTKPGGSPEMFEIPYESITGVVEVGTARNFTLRPIKITSASPLGTYLFTLVAIDADGNMSAPDNTSFTLTDLNFFSFSTPRIEGIYPDAGGWGTEVSLSGLFPTSAEETLSVFINELECPIEHTEYSVSVTIPFGARSGPLVLRSSRGTIVSSPGMFMVDEAVAIQPWQPANFNELDEEVLSEDLEVTAGENLALVAVTTRLLKDGGGVIWYVEGIEGGNAVVGTINEEGVYSAPAGVSEPLDVVISATLIFDTGVFDEVIVTVRPKAIPPGGGMVSAVAGGNLISGDGLTALEIPPGALAADTSISLRTLPTVELPPANPGMRVLGAVEFLPEGLTFLNPVYGYLPLQRSMPPGVPVTIRVFDPVGGVYEPGSITGTVGDDGLFAEFLLSHFSVYVAEESSAYPGAPNVAPTIAGVATTSVGSLSPSISDQEGRAFPLFFSGTDFYADLRVSFLNAAPDNTPATALSHDTLIVSQDGTQAGMTLHLDPDPTLAAGASRDYRIVLTRPGIGSAEVTITVNGLGELIVADSTTLPWNNMPASTFSTMVVPATSRILISQGEMDINCTGPILVDGSIEAFGADGASGFRSEPAAGGLTGGGGGRAVTEFPCKDPIFGFITDRKVRPINRGKDGNVVSMVNGVTRGAGGAAGVSVEFDLDELFERLASCIGSLGFDCARLVAEIVNTANQIDDLASGDVSGKFGAGGDAATATSPDGHGGGGGGGSGSFLLEVTIPATSLGYFMRSTGGGGGAGGEGGRSVTLLSESHITVNGSISTAGGDGGDGASENELEMGIANPWPVPDLTISTQIDIDCFAGAGGGGGAGGKLVLKGNQGVFAPSSALEYRGGQGGLGGVADVDPAAAVSRWGDTRSISSRGQTRGAIRAGSLFNTEILRTHATNRFLLPLQGIPGQLLFSRASRSLKTTVSVLYDPANGGGTGSFDALLDNDNRCYHGYAVLRNGFNTIIGAGAQSITILCIAVAALCSELNATETHYPGTELLLKYVPVRSPRFPGGQDL